METTVKTTSAKVVYKRTTTYHEAGEKYEMTVFVELADECKNNICHFAVTCDINRVARNGRRVDVGGGAAHDEILKHFKSLAPFVALHGSDCHGVPSYAVANGSYFFKKGNRETAIKLLRITEAEAVQLEAAAVDELYFRYLLYSLGIVARWESEAQAAIEKLNEINGRHIWVNPYTPENERRNIEPLNDDEKALISDRLNTGYYTSEAIAQRQVEALAAEIEKKRAKVLADYDKATEKARAARDVALAVLDSGITADNFIYYEHSNTLTFNWVDYLDKVTDSEIEHFKAVTDFSKLPANIVIKNKG